jgi:Lon-like ATP-dependent protease
MFGGKKLDPKESDSATAKEGEEKACEKAGEKAGENASSESVVTSAAAMPDPEAPEKPRPWVEVTDESIGAKERASASNAGDDARDGSNESSGGQLTRVGRGDNAPRYPIVNPLPVLRKPLFPGVMMPMTVNDPVVIETCLDLVDRGTPYVGVFLAKDGSLAGLGDENAVGGSGGTNLENGLITDLSDIHRIGMFAEIQKISKVPLMGIGKGGEIEDSPQMIAQMLLWGHRRISIEDMMNVGPPMSVSINHLDDGFNSKTVKSDMVKAYTNQIVSVLRDLVKINPLLKEHMNHIVSRMDVTDPFGLADFAAYITTADGEELQRILETLDAEERLNRVLTLLMKERELADLQQEISRKVEEKVNENQRKYLLNEQLKSIKKELGMEKDDKDTLITKYQKAIDESGLPEESEALQAMKDELQKLTFLEKNSSEFNVTRTYLDWLTCLPWTKFSEDSLDIPKARLILDEDHYGLSDIKDRILEFIAVGQLTGSVDGRIICFVGPPGTGKTSIAKSIARSLNREFYRFSVGGLSDVSEIKGHRRTYVGAMPGKIVQCMKQTNVSNPLLLIDEIDKLASHGRGGDPASALLELLDPNQNDSFMDHYLDVPVDLSKVIFVCTANVLENIPGPLMDRMEVSPPPPSLLPSFLPSFHPSHLRIFSSFLPPPSPSNCPSSLPSSLLFSPSFLTR